VLFGATGDLARRKLIPAIYNLHHDKQLPDNFAVCGYARKPKDDAAFRDELKREVAKYSRQKPEADWDELAKRFFYVSGEFKDDAGYGRLKTKLAEIDKQCGTAGNRLFYFAVGSEYFVTLGEELSRNGLLHRFRYGSTQKPWMRVVLEKPIGHDSESCREILSRLGEFAGEDQVYRIDHYLGKETVQNILAMRFGNCIFEPLWNRKYVDHVQITVAEQEGVGTRAGYYESAGALRDVVQNHVLQLLCLVAMESPGTMSADDVRNEKVKILRNLHKMDAKQVAEHTVRGQYGPVTPQGGEKLVGYRQEPGVAPNSMTETYVAIRCFVDTWRWAGVPFLLRTGKRMPRRETQISIHFRMPPLQLFEDSPAASECVGNVLRIHVQPDEGISMDIAAKVPGAGMRLQNVDMDFNYAKAFAGQSPEAYERLLVDAMNGAATLFTRDDEVLSQWDFVNQILDGWRKKPPPQFPNYSALTWGPQDARRLVPPCSAGWDMERE